ncbi:MAG TPA: hypothetical protein VGP17_06950 [Solirubrobacteraceae bacterium]|jgi:hypothetical protein|nr:hypothetical protein [Solirubrobacteraceae bacterium]
MSISGLTPPIDIPWKLVGTSSDMMDTTFCDNLFPVMWRSSMAMFAYEPPAEEQPEGLCGQRICFVKVSCSITGYQPTEQEVAEGFTEFSGIDVEQLNDIFTEYFACYGALLNVAVFPEDPSTELTSYPYFMDFEPKLRDLYQPATDTNDILTASHSQVNAGKSFTTTKSSQTGLSLGGKAGLSATEPESHVTASAEASGTLSHTWGETEQDTTSTQSDGARDRREEQGVTTQINQLYNLLTGYHVGTNRATFIMLPRPNTLQATDHRSFIQGLRMIEGVQDFFFTIARPSTMDGFRLEGRLETAHFPENVTVHTPTPVYNETTETFLVEAHEPGGNISAQYLNLESVGDTKHTVPTGWVIDRSKGDPGHPGISEVANNSNEQANESLRGYNYQASGDAAVQISGTINSAGGWGSGAEFSREYTVFLRSEQPVSGATGASTVTSPFFITARQLCTSVTVEQECINGAGTGAGAAGGASAATAIVAEGTLNVAAPPAIAISRTPVLKEMLRNIHAALTNVRQLPDQRARGSFGFLQSDYLAGRVAAILDKDLANVKLGRLRNVRASEATLAALKDHTLGALLTGHAYTIHRESKLALTEVYNAREAVVRAIAKGPKFAAPEKPAGRPTPSTTRRKR